MTNIVDLPGEKWRSIVGYEGLYIVSDKGRVQTVPHAVLDSNGRTRYIKARILAPIVPRPGSAPWAALSGGTAQADVERFRVPDLVWIAFIKKTLPKNPYHVGHKDGNPLNCAANNLVIRRKRRPKGVPLHRRERDENGWRIPAPGTISRRFYDMLREGHDISKIAHDLNMKPANASMTAHKIRNPDKETEECISTWQATVPF